MRAAVVTALVLAANVASAQEHPLADGAVGLGGVSRHLSYHQDVFGRFAPYDLALAPSVLFRGEVYLFGATPLTALRDLGVVGAAELVFGVSSQGADGRARDTSFTSAEAGLRYRFPYAAGEFGVSARWVLQRFAIGAGAPGDPALVPEIAYQSVRAGVDLRHRVHPRVAVTAAIGWLFVLDAGELTERYFPRATIQAADASLGVAFAVTSGIEVRATLGARRYFHDMRVEPGDPYLAGGALDHVFSGALTAAWRR